VRRYALKISILAALEVYRLEGKHLVDDRLFLMTKFFNLDFHGTKFAVPKGNLLDLFEHHTELVAKASYEVQSSVPLEVFELFLKALESGGKVTVTKENADAISHLAKEFWLEDLLSECSALQIASTPELIAALSERISKLEGQISCQPLLHFAELKESIANHERQLEDLNYRISALEPNLRTELEELKSVSPTPIPTPTPVPPVSPTKSLKGTEFPLTEAKSLDGIISHLTRGHGGNVHDKGIVTITSKSVYTDSSAHAVVNVADLAADSYFHSNGGPDQWVCWNFHKRRLNPTHYTIRIQGLKSWVVESSLTGKAWTEIDRKTDNEDFKDGLETASFAVSNAAKCRFIRLTQTGKNHNENDFLVIYAFEVFGTLLE
jgi:hypothetical protein